MLKKIALGILKKMKFLPASFYMKIYYEYYTGKKLDLKNPVEFNQKIQWLKVYYKPAILNKLVDKYEVRSYVEQKIGSKYLNELIGVYYNAKDVNFDALPDRFVIKGAHGYNFNLIVKDKSAVKSSRAKYLFRKWLLRNQYYRGGLEWAYKDVKPKLVAEKYLEEIGKGVINDYKFYCFHGTPKFVQVDADRGIENYKAFFDLKWKQLPFLKGKGELPKDSIQKPKNFEKMSRLAAKLAADFPFVRVDFYNIDGKIIFGEMTFYPGDGRQEFKPDEYNLIVGNYLQLPSIPKGQKYITTI